MKYIISNRPGASDLWHVAVQRELRGEKTGKVFKVYHVTQCTGKQLGGPWGQHVSELEPPHYHKCPRCFPQQKRS